MGIPIGTDEYVDEFFKVKIDQIKDIYYKVKRLKRKLTKLWLLRTCMSTCRVMHWMRTMDPAKIMPHLKEFDKIQFDLLQHISNTHFDDTDMLQAKLPLSRSGLVGIRSAEDHAHAAFIASTVNNSKLVDQLLRGQEFEDDELVASVASYNALVPNNQIDINTLGGQQSIPQKSLSIAIDSTIRRRLITMINGMQDAPTVNLHNERMLSIREYSSYGWLLAVPNKNFGHDMTDEEVESSLQIRLGHINTLWRYQCPGTGSDAAHATVERSGLDLLKCKKFYKQRHDPLRDKCANVASSIGLHPELESVGVLRDGSAKRPGDVILPTYDRGSKAAIDITVINNKQTVLTSSVPQIVGRTALHGETSKNNKWKDLCASVNVNFIPMSVDVYGHWGREARAVFYEFARRKSLFTGRQPDVELKFLYQSLSVILQRHNARILIAHKEKAAPNADEEEEEHDVDVDPILLSEDDVTPLA
jgi:hypothetical protein